mmetsp:Transcript_6511/g.17002  ORF Transcript_6511/g.17002 Transcript_6511/m.17002 type:complete len:142 (-) Transcript_6511:62-487(-)
MHEEVVVLRCRVMTTSGVSRETFCPRSSLACRGVAEGRKPANEPHPPAADAVMREEGMSRMPRIRGLGLPPPDGPPPPPPPPPPPRRLERSFDRSEWCALSGKIMVLMKNQMKSATAQKQSAMMLNRHGDRRSTIVPSAFK